MQVTEKTHDEVQSVTEAQTGNLPSVTTGVSPAMAVRQPRQKSAAATAASLSQITRAIAKITQDVGIVPKEGENKFHGYKYARMEDVLQRLTPLLAEHGIVIIQTEIERNLFDNASAVSVTYQFTIAHASGEVWPDRPVQTAISRARDSKGNFDDKSVNKCHTSARKYFLLSLFQIATGDMDDADDDGRISKSRRVPMQIVRSGETRATLQDADAIDDATEIHGDQSPTPQQRDRNPAVEPSAPSPAVIGDARGADGDAPVPTPAQYAEKWEVICRKATNGDALAKMWNGEKELRKIITWDEGEFDALKDKVGKAIKFLREEPRP